jgi:hypothetical protein
VPIDRLSMHGHHHSTAAMIVSLVIWAATLGAIVYWVMAKIRRIYRGPIEPKPRRELSPRARRFLFTAAAILLVAGIAIGLSPVGSFVGLLLVATLAIRSRRNRNALAIPARSESSP